MDLKDFFELGNQVKDVKAAIMKLDILSSRMMPKRIQKHLEAAIVKLGVFRTLAEDEMIKNFGDDSRYIPAVFYGDNRRIDLEGKAYYLWK